MYEDTVPCVGTFLLLSKCSDIIFISVLPSLVNLTKNKYVLSH